MSLLAEVAHLEANVSHGFGEQCRHYDGKTYLVVDLRGNYAPRVQSVMEIELLRNVLNAALNLEREQGGSETTSVAEETNTLALCGLAVNVGNQAAQAAVDTSTVHVTTLGRDFNARLNAGRKSLLCQGHESFLDLLVGDGGGIIKISEFGRDLSEDGVRWVYEVVVVEQARVRLGDKLASRRVERHVVEAVQRSLLLLSAAIDTVSVQARLQGLFPCVVGLVTGVYGLSVALDREVAVDNRVLACKVRLVEVVHVPDVRAAQASVDSDGSVRANKHGYATSSAGGTGIALRVQGNVTSHNNGVTAVPRRRLDPVDAVEQGVGSTVAGVHRIDTLDVVVATLFEELHQDRLDRLGLVKERLGADLEASDGLGVYAVLLEQRGDGCQGKRVHVCATSKSVPLLCRQTCFCCQERGQHTFAVVAERHLGLAEANCVLALRDAIELLKLGLVDALKRGKLERSAMARQQHLDSPGWGSTAQWP